MKAHVSNLVGSPNFELRRISSIPTHPQSALIAILARRVCCQHYSSTDFGPNIFIFATYTAQHMHTLKINQDVSKRKL